MAGTPTAVPKGWYPDPHGRLVPVVGRRRVDEPRLRSARSRPSGDPRPVGPT